MNLIYFLGMIVPTRFFSFLIIYFTIDNLKKYRTMAFKILAILTIVPCLYIVFRTPFKEKIRKQNNFVNSKPTDSLLYRMMVAKKAEMEKCFDRLYEAADVTFVESMLITSDIQQSSKKYRTIKAITSMDGGTDKFESIDITPTFEIADCFHIGEDKFYVIRSGSIEYAISEGDLDFSAKKLATIFMLLTESLEKRDLVAFTKLLDSRKIELYNITLEVVKKDVLDFFEAIHKKDGEKALSMALSKASKHSQIFKYAFSKPLDPLRASEALKEKLSDGTAEEIKLLLEKGATFEFDDGTQRLPILNVTNNKAHFNEIINLYLANGGDLNAKSVKGKTLFLSAQSVEQIDYLLLKGANLNEADDDGMNLLLYHSQFGNNPDRFSLMKHLVSKGIDRNKRNSRGKTAYEIIKNDYCSGGSRKKECIDFEYLK